MKKPIKCQICGTTYHVSIIDWRGLGLRTVDTKELQKNAKRLCPPCRRTVANIVVESTRPFTTDSEELDTMVEPVGPRSVPKTEKIETTIEDHMANDIVLGIMEITQNETKPKLKTEWNVTVLPPE